MSKRVTLRWYRVYVQNMLHGDFIAWQNKVHLAVSIPFYKDLTSSNIVELEENAKNELLKYCKDNNVPLAEDSNIIVTGIVPLETFISSTDVEEAKQLKEEQYGKEA